MARFERHAPGQFSWVDLMTPDTEAATTFYEALFGWTHEASQDDGGGAYTMFRKDGLLVAGMGGMTPEMKAAGMPSVWNSYITVESVDDTTKRAEGLGAAPQMPAIDIRVDGDLVGRMTVLADPSGARFSVWQPGNHAGTELANVPGTHAWNELCSRDPAASSKFYRDLFGWKIVEAEGGEGYLEIVNGERLNGGILTWSPDMGDIPPSWSVYFAVEDCSKALDRVRGLGGQAYMGPIDIPAGKFGVAADSQGAVFNVCYLENPDD